MNKDIPSTGNTIHALFEQQVAENPQSTAIKFNEQRLTYSQFNQKVNQLAHFLREKGVSPDTQVAIVMQRSVEQLICIFGILKAGGAYVPLDPNHPENRLLETLNDNSTPFLITHTPFRKKFAPYEGQLILYDKEQKKLQSQPISNPVHITQPHHLAYVIYTSGSTGKPKGVLIEHRTVVNFGLWFSEYTECYREENIDYSSNYAFDMAIANTILPLMLGLSIIICADEVKKDLRNYLEFLHKNKINLIKITPSYFKALLYDIENHPINLPHLKTIILGGEQLGSQECNLWLRRYPEHILINEYGPTETTVAVSIQKVSQSLLPALENHVPIGKPGNNIVFRLFDKEINAVNKGEIGELYIGGDCLARGYLNQPDITNERFIFNPANKEERLYKTGDLCRELNDGVIEYLGRIDHQVKIRGFRVELSEIEQSLLSHKQIKSVIALAQEIQSSEKQLIAYYIAKKPTFNPDFNQLRKYLQERLPDHMIPSAFIRVDHFPMNANGKLDREALPLPQFSSGKGSSAAGNELELALVNIWEEELNITGLGIHDNFFELGGHSLIGDRIVSRIKQQLKKDINIKELYRASTPAGLAKVLKRKGKLMSVQRRKKMSRKQAILPLSDFQLILWLSNTLAPKVRKLNIIGRKRLQGKIDINALNYAFECLFEKHDLLSYQVFKLKPAQRPHECQFQLVEKNLDSLSNIEMESILSDSINELIKFYPWPSHSRLIVARLFYLNDNLCELQLCLPHVISDGVSMNILFSDLSKFYLQYNHQHSLTKQNAVQYYDYVKNEQKINGNSKASQSFWKNYLQQTTLFSFPSEFIVKTKFYQKFRYSSYVEIPESALKRLQLFCIEHHFSINDALCAALGLALTKYCKNSNAHSIVMNSVKSTRDNPDYDEVIGCFLRLEPIKIIVKKRPSLLGYTRQVHQSIMDTAEHQHSSSLLKLAAINPYPAKIGFIKKLGIKLLTSFYRRSLPKLNYHNQFNSLEKLAALNKRNNFIININLWDNFLSTASNSADSSLFGSKITHLAIPHNDLLSVDYVLDVCFIRDNNQIPYLVISGNLMPEFRTQLAQEIIEIIDHSIPDLLSEEELPLATESTGFL